MIGVDPYIYVNGDFNGNKEFTAGVAQGGPNENCALVAVKNSPQRVCSQAAKKLRQLARKFDILAKMDNPLDSLLQDKINNMTLVKAADGKDG